MRFLSYKQMKMLEHTVNKMIKNLITILITVFVVSITTACSNNGQPPPANAIASAHPLATRAGEQVLAEGGNAFDAAIAVSATLAVVEPYASGLGGGGFWLLYKADSNQYVMLDGREKAPLEAYRDLYLDRFGNPIPGASITGPLSAGIPGIPASLVHLATRYGRLPLGKSLEPAIQIARNGFTIDDVYRKFAQLRLRALRSYPESARIFLVNGEVPPPGYVLKQEDLAKTLEQLAQQGNAGFYTGSTAEHMVNDVRAFSGIWQLKDLQDYTVKERAPITTHYKGFKIVAASPPSSGGVAIATMLRMLEHYDLSKMDNATRKHLLIEIMRRAYHDRARFLGDSDYYPVPVGKLISNENAEHHIKSINLKEATPSEFLPDADNPGGAGTDTTHFSILDREGNRVAATLSINYPFGSCFVPRGTGVLLNDEMDDFSIKPGVPNAYGLVGAQANAIESGKRPLSSMTPTFVENKDGVAILGTPGGSRIITMVLLGILEYIDGADAKTIVAAPRFHHQYLPDQVIYEDNAFTPEEKSRLLAMGHELRPNSTTYGEGQYTYGNMQVVIWNKKKNQVSAASDPRGIGSATVQALP